MVSDLTSWKTTFAASACGALLLGGLLMSGSTSGLSARPGSAVKCHGKVATWVGTPGDDRIPVGRLRRGSVVASLGGDDRFQQSGGHTTRFTVCLGPGEDEVKIYKGRNVNSLFDGGSGDDEFGAGFRNGGGNLFGNAAWIGGSGDDQMQGSHGSDAIRAGAGNDEVWGGRHADRLRLGAGDDIGVGERGHDKLFGGAGDDKLSGARRGKAKPTQRDIADGGDGNDKCVAPTVRRCEA